MDNSSLGLSPLPWQLTPWDNLQKLRRQSRLPHALLIYGQEGQGKKHLANIFVQGMVCEGSNDGIACGNCPVCAQFAAATSPNIRWIVPEENRKGIGVDQVRSLIDYIELSEGGQGKFVIMSPADSMSIGAANSLLKTLEEPSGNAVIILIASRLSHLPATILSRCRRIEVFSSDPMLSQKWLEDSNVSDAALALSLSGGGAIAARDLYTSGELLEFDKVVRGVGGVIINRAGFAQVSTHWRTISPERLLDWMLVLAERISRCSIGLKVPPLDLSSLDKLDRLGGTLNASRLFTAYDSLIALKAGYNASVNKDLLLDNLLCIWDGVKN